MQDQGASKTMNSTQDMDKLPAAPMNASSSSNAGKPPGLAAAEASNLSKHRESRREELSAAQLGAISMAIKQRRDACDSLRCLVFGFVGNEDWRRNDQHLIYEQRRGTKEEVLQLFKVWTQIDEDGSGDIEYHEFIDFFSKTKADRLLGMKCVKYLVGSGEDENKLPHEERRRGCTVEDMMRLIWLKSADEDVAVMLEIFKLAALHNKRLPTPKLLPKRKRHELLENFKWLDTNSNGIISYGDLVDGGLMDEETANELMMKYDLDGSGDLDGEEFLEMLCPHGYRAHEGSKKVVDKEGRLITYVQNNDFTGWMFEDDAKSLQSFQDPFQELS
jgi:Ca2+-binding EF-hand superfamily protein